jgi:hypothetical protein
LEPKSKELVSRLDLRFYEKQTKKLKLISKVHFEIKN